MYGSLSGVVSNYLKVLMTDFAGAKPLRYVAVNGGQVFSSKKVLQLYGRATGVLDLPLSQARSSRYLHIRVRNFSESVALIQFKGDV